MTRGKYQATKVRELLKLIKPTNLNKPILVVFAVIPMLTSSVCAVSPTPNGRQPDAIMNSDNNLHKVWREQTEGVWSIYYANNGGDGVEKNMGNDKNPTKIIISSTATEKFHPQIAIDVETVIIYVVWVECSIDGTLSWMYSGSSDNGKTWTFPLYIDRATATNNNLVLRVTEDGNLELFQGKTVFYSFTPDIDGDLFSDREDPDPMKYEVVTGEEFDADVVVVEPMLGVSVAMDYDGVSEKPPTITEIYPEVEFEGSVTGYYDITTESLEAFTSIIKIQYDETTLSVNEEYLRMYCWDGDSWNILLDGALGEDTGIDTENNFVWASTTHFSPFTLGSSDSDGDGLLDGEELTPQTIDLKYKNFDFDRSNEGFSQLTDQNDVLRSSIDWNEANKRIELITDRSDAGDLLYGRAIPESIRSDGSPWSVSFRWGTIDRGNWQNAIAFFIANQDNFADTTTNLYESSNSITILYGSMDSSGPTTSLLITYRDENGVHCQPDPGFTGIPHEEYVFKIEHINQFTPTRIHELKFTVSDDAQTRVVGTCPLSATGNDFIFDAFGVGTRGLASSKTSSTHAWVDDIIVTGEMARIKVTTDPLDPDTDGDWLWDGWQDLVQDGIFDSDGLDDITGTSDDELPGELTYNTDPSIPNFIGNTGHENCQDFTGECCGNKCKYSINRVNGNLYLPQEDLIIRGLGFNIKPTRTYNSHNKYIDGPFGMGWSHNYDMHLQIETSGDITVAEADGSFHAYTLQADGSYLAPPSVHSQIKSDGSGYLLRMKNGEVFSFDSAGVLMLETDKNGNNLHFSYSGDELTSVYDDAGTGITYIYNTDGRVESLTEPSFGVISFTYDDAGHLIEVMDASGSSTKYAYYSDGNMWRFIDGINGMDTFVYLKGPHGRDLVQYALRSEYDPVADSGVNAFTKYEFEYFYPKFTQTTNARGFESLTIFDNAGSPIQENGPICCGGISYKTWDSDKNLASITDANGHTTTFTYDAFGNMLTRTDAKGFMTSYTWQNEDSPTNYISLKIDETDALGRITAYDFNMNGNLIQNTDPSGSQTLYTYTSEGLVYSTIDPMGEETLFEYDAEGNMISMLDPTGENTEIQYDDSNRIIGVYYPNDHAVEYLYDETGRTIEEKSSEYEWNDVLVWDKTANMYLSIPVISVLDATTTDKTRDYDGEGNLLLTTDENGHQTAYDYDESLSVLKSTADAKGETTEFGYDLNGNMIWRMDANGGLTQYVYDGLDRKIQDIDRLGQITYYAYDGVGNLLSTTDRNGHQTTYEYDELNRRIKTIDALGNEQVSVYDSVGNMVSTTNARGYLTTMEYDELNRVVLTTDATGKTTGYEYDANGNRIEVTNLLGQSTFHYYDELNRIAKIQDPLGQETMFEYDSMGNKVKEIDANGNVKLFDYNVDGRLISTTYATGSVISYDYDDAGNMISITDGNGHTTYQEYNELNRVNKLIHPSGNFKTFSYDAVGNMVGRTDENGQTTTYMYDTLNRRTATSYPDGTYIYNDYDNEGNLLQTLSTYGAGENVSYLYNQLNRITSKTVDYGDFQKTISYTYDENGNRLTMTDPLGGTTTYAYNALDRPASITDPSGDSTLYSYDTLGRRIRVQYSGSPQSTNYTYDNAGRFVTLEHFSNGNPLSSYQYIYDNVGNILTLNESGVGNTSYTYDAVYHLIHAAYPDGSYETYTYDASGNRLSKETDTKLIEYTYDSDNRLLSDSTYTYTYDNNGNQMSKERVVQSCDPLDPFGICFDIIETISYTYDYENRLIAVNPPSEPNSSYSYAADGTRLSVTVGNLTTYYLYDRSNFIMELDVSGNVIASYVNGPGIDEPLRMDRGGYSSSYMSDHLGSVRALVGSDGSYAAQYGYDAFGGVAQETGSVQNPYRFTAREWDSDVGLYYYRARSYDPALGRFLQKDPAGMVDGPNQYQYVGGNPVNWVDPNGTFSYLYCTSIAGMAFADYYWNYYPKGRDDKWGHAYVGCKLRQTGCSYWTTWSIAWGKEFNDIIGQLFGNSGPSVYDAWATTDGWSWGSEGRWVTVGWGWFSWREYRYYPCNQILDSYYHSLRLKTYTEWDSN